MGCSSLPGGMLSLSHKYLLFPWSDSTVEMQLVIFDFQFQESPVSFWIWSFIFSNCHILQDIKGPKCKWCKITFCLSFCILDCSPPHPPELHLTWPYIKCTLPSRNLRDYFKAWKSLILLVAAIYYHRSGFCCPASSRSYPPISPCRSRYFGTNNLYCLLS